MSKILCIIDGMTDPGFRYEEYHNLSSMNLLGYIDTTDGQSPESLGCILRLLGTKEIPPYLRGYAEALGYGIAVNKDDLIFRGSWFSLDENGCCNVPTSAPQEPGKSEEYHYYYLEQYKSLLVIPQMAGCIEDIVTFPPYDCDGQDARNLCPQGSEVVSRVFGEQLADDRCLILWGQSVPSEMEPFAHKAAVISGTAVVKGIAGLLDMDLICVDGATGDTDTDLYEKTQKTLEAAESYPFVLIHINGADEASHRKDVSEKKEFLYKVDYVVLKTFLESGHDIYVVSDHGTDPLSGQHLGDRQPVFSNTAERI